MLNIILFDTHFQFCTYFLGSVLNTYVERRTYGDYKKTFTFTHLGENKTQHKKLSILRDTFINKVCNTRMNPSNIIVRYLFNSLTPPPFSLCLLFHSSSYQYRCAVRKVPFLYCLRFRCRFCQ